MKTPVQGRGGQKTNPVLSNTVYNFRHSPQAAAKEPEAKATGTDGDSDNENEGFSGWLRTGEGVEYMKIFVVCNTFMVVLTMSWPHLKTMFTIAYEYWTEEQ